MISQLANAISEKHTKTAQFYQFDPVGHSKFYLSALEWVLDEIEKIQSKSNNSWISIDALPDDDENDYLVYSIHTKVYEKANLSQLKQMITNSAKITHWQPLPQPPKERENDIN